MVDNAKKSKFIMISLKNVGITYDDNGNTIINSTSFQQGSGIKCLGVAINKNWNMHCQTPSLTEKMSK